MKTLLIVDDDKAFCVALSNNLTKRGYDIKCAHHVQEGIGLAKNFEPEWALIDLKMPGKSGLELIPALLSIDAKTKIVVLTGYADIATAVEAIKLGAIHYLTKPVSTDEIIHAFDRNEGDPTIPIKAELLSWSEAEYEHILNALKRNHQNISATARELGMHRRTLQRKLEKIPKKYREGLPPSS